MLERFHAVEHIDHHGYNSHHTLVGGGSGPSCPATLRSPGHNEVLDRYAEWLLAQVRREAANRSLPEISRIAPVPRLCNQGKVVAWLDFRRNRKDDTVKPGYGFEIEFAQPVLPECGPMALGYGAHFGLGQFRTA